MLAVLAEAALRTVLLGSAIGLGLWLCRVRHPQLQMTAWLVVLAASLAMPLVMHWTTVTITVHLPADAGAAAPVAWSPDDAPFIPSVQAPLLDDAAVARAISVEGAHALPLWTVATTIYLLVAGWLLLRLAIGLVLTWRLVRTAQPLAGAANLRLSEAIASPVTIGSTILVPPQWRSWDARKQAAVLAHETSHIAHRDFYVLMLAAINRALFWFSPFAWWHHRRLAELAEMISDAKAVEALRDRVSYAEILLEIVQAPRRRALAIEMARPSTVRARIEHILSDAGAWPSIAPVRRLALAVLVLPVAVLSGLAIATRTETAAAKAVPGPADLGAPAGRAERIAFYRTGQRGVFAVSRQGNAMYGQFTGQRRVQLASAEPGHYSFADNGGLLSFVMGDEAPKELVLHQFDRDLPAARITEFAPCEGPTETSSADDYAGWYELNANRVVTVGATAGGLRLSETGRGSFAVTADCRDSFSSKSDDLVLFLRDGKGKVSRLLLQDPLLGARVARRVDENRAKAIEETFARRIAEVPDRFREQVPTPGSRDMVLRGIADLQAGTPHYDLMSPSLAANIRQHATWLQTTFKTLGAVEAIFFRGVGSGGYDIYGVKFANGTAEFRLLMTTDGKADDVIFRPDGNQAAGEVLDCASEASLRMRADPTPIRLTVYNASGGDIRLHRLDDRGQRVAQSAVGDDLSSSFTTDVGTPWVVADASGRCIEIILPGRRTRFHTVEAIRGGADRFGERRSAPMPDSEKRLRGYIEAIVRGEPDYVHMTAEVAAYTRQQLTMNQAILSRLGEVRAFSFRGVTALDSDIYMVHFANGTAEWRIGLARNGSIGRIALGPSY